MAKAGLNNKSSFHKKPHQGVASDKGKRFMPPAPQTQPMQGVAKQSSVSK